MRDIEDTSLLTRMARNMGLLTNALINYILEEREVLDFEYFAQGHILSVDRETASFILSWRTLDMLVKFLYQTPALVKQYVRTGVFVFLNTKQWITCHSIIIQAKKPIKQTKEPIKQAKKVLNRNDVPPYKWQN